MGAGLQMDHFRAEADSIAFYARTIVGGECVENPGALSVTSRQVVGTCWVSNYNGRTFYFTGFEHIEGDLVRWQNRFTGAAGIVARAMLDGARAAPCVEACIPEEQCPPNESEQ